jgi:malate dehydrogenase (oxaloacetate-decarboxylating)
VFSGSGASAIACVKLIQSFGKLGHMGEFGDIILCDSKGIVHRDRGDLNRYKRDLADTTNKHGRKGSLADALRGADVFIGLSQANIVTEDMVRSMNAQPVIFAMANPVPEIMPHLARAAGAVVVATGRSDFLNQINNVLAFPGVFRGALDAGAKVINEEMKVAAARTLAEIVIEPVPERILPDPLDRTVGARIGEAVAAAARKSGVCR